MSARHCLCLVGLAIFTGACAQYGLLTPPQRELRKTQASYLRDNAPALQERLAAEGHQGALVVFLPSREPLTALGVSPGAALETLLEDNSLDLIRPSESQVATAAFIYRADVGLAPRWLLLTDAIADIETRDRLKAVDAGLGRLRSDLDAVRTSTEGELATFRAALGETAEKIRLLQEFSTDSAKLGVLQQAQLDELQERAQLLSEHLAKLYTGAASQAETLDKLQASLQPQLDSIQKQVAALEQQLKRF